jgi:signal transduction histidine kinase
VAPQTWDFLSSTLEAAAILTVPLFFQNRTSGRMLLASGKPRVFEEEEAVFLLQVMEHALPLIDHIRLVDQLASDAAREERRKLARDIHDGVIQPYVGLQMGLAGLANRLRAGEGDLDVEIRKLIEFTNSGIADLRRQVASLREGGTDGGSLRPAVFRFAERFTEATGIRVELDAPPSLPVSDRLAGEIFQMIAEGLSNIRRHTRSSQAKVHLSCARGMLNLRIENESPNGAGFGSFTPSSIAERSAALGGRLRVDRREDGGTIVAVEIPL